MFRIVKSFSDVSFAPIFRGKAAKNVHCNWVPSKLSILRKIEKKSLKIFDFQCCWSWISKLKAKRPRRPEESSVLAEFRSVSWSSYKLQVSERIWPSRKPLLVWGEGPSFFSVSPAPWSVELQLFALPPPPSPFLPPQNIFGCSIMNTSSKNGNANGVCWVLGCKNML